jgi:hypothetical protein
MFHTGIHFFDNRGKEIKMGYKTILFFELRANERRRIERAVGGLSQFDGRTCITPALGEERAKEIIIAAQRAASRPLRFLVMDTDDFVSGWGMAYDDVAFGGPFGAAV